MLAVPDVLRVAAFRRVWLSGLASNAGSWLQVVASGWLIYNITGSEAAVGALALTARLPAIALSTIAGHLADRFDRRLVGVATGAAQAAAAAGLAVSAALGVLSVPLIFAFTFLVGVGFALGLPATLALIGELAGRERLPAAVRLNAAGINVARMIGPTIGGFVLAFSGPTACFTLNAFSFLSLVAVLARMPAMPPAHHAATSSTRDALRHARADPAARRLLLGAAAFCVLASPLQELAPVVAERVGAGKSGLGFLLGVMGGGGILGAWLLAILERRGLARHLALPIGTGLFAVGMATVALAQVEWLALIGMVIGGVFWIWMFTLTNTAIQLTSPPALLGRMLGLYQLAVIGPIAIGSLAAGGLAEVVGIGPSLGLCAGLLALLGIWGGLHPVHDIDRTPDPAEALVGPGG